MSDGQRISDLTSAVVAHLSKQRALIENHLADEESRRKYEAAAGKRGLLRGSVVTVSGRCGVA
ncbi:MAG TPA: hypothetical protein VHE78_02225 [Gemmatimonadaceae bacterium]|nr:hypothetical protein [Gemmatimonadaceae bacterium]